MNPWTLARYLAGNARAIRTVAENSAALPFSIALVLLTAVARNYDQTHISETPLWLFGSLIFSLFSGSLLYLIVYKGFVRRHLSNETKPSENAQWSRFMALFWMTAPIAWLYAIPVERFLPSYHAAQANLTLLAIVSVWRVLLMSRIISVLNGVRFRRAVGLILLGASIEVIIVGFFGVNLSKRIMAGMSGMRNSPEEDLLSSALGTAWISSWVVLLVMPILLAAWHFRGSTVPFPAKVSRKAPWITLSAFVIAWAALAWPEQMKQRLFLQHQQLVFSHRYAEALQLLQQHQRRDFPASRRLEPNPYEYTVWDHLPPVVSILSTNTAPWIRDVYLSHLSRTLVHQRSRYDSLTNVAPMYEAVERLPEGREWMRTNQTQLARQGITGGSRGREDSSSAEERAHRKILDAFQRLEMTATNLGRLKIN